MQDFGIAFGEADTLQVLDIYAASEEPIPGISAPALVNVVASREATKVAYAPSVGQAIAALTAEARSGDLILTLGAGSVSHASGLLLSALRESQPSSSNDTPLRT
jgi:UDP-N-acetylmuramate--alanine ligase